MYNDRQVSHTQGLEWKFKHPRRFLDTHKCGCLLVAPVIYLGFLGSRGRKKGLTEGNLGMTLTVQGGKIPSPENNYEFQF